MTRPLTQANAALDRLIGEFGGQVPIGSIVKALAHAIDCLRLAGVEAGLLVAAEAMARTNLTARLQVHAVRA